MTTATSLDAPAPVRPTHERAIAIRGLHHSYGDVEAVGGIDLDVRAGEILALLGPNGAGKTTTVEILEGYLKPTAGEVRVLGDDPWRGLHRDRIGIVLQDTAPEQNLSVRECLRLYAGYYPAPRPVDETIGLVGLTEQADQLATALSGGQRRRLDVALALIGDPDLIFLDEPTTGFDPAARRAAWEVVSGLRALGKTILLTTHYMEEAERLADRIVVMVQGRIVADGTPATLGGRNRARATIAFRLPGDADAPGLLPSGEGVAADAHGVYTVHTPQPTNDLLALTTWAVAHGLELEGLEVRQPTLEDVYLELTR